MTNTAPLTPPDCDLRDFQFMPVDVRRLLTSETWVLGTGDERAAAMTLWLESWQQVPAGSIPKDDRMLAHLSQSGTKWKKVRAHVLRGWVEASDGRLYHAVVAEKVLEAWIEKLMNSFSGAAGNAKRWGIAIETESIKERVLIAIGLLRKIAPQSKTLKKKSVAMIESGSPPDNNTGDSIESGGDKKVSGGDSDTSQGGIAIDSKGTVKGLLTTTVPKGTDANAPPDPVDQLAITKKAIWAEGKALFASRDIPGDKAGKILGDLLNRFSPEIVLDAVRAGAKAETPDPTSYLTACCQRAIGERAKVQKQSRHNGFDETDYTEGVTADGRIA